MKAYEVSIKPWPHNRTIVAAKTPGQAKSDLVISAKEIGYPLTYTDFAVKRAPEFDHLARAAKNKQTLGFEADNYQWGCLR